MKLEIFHKTACAYEKPVEQARLSFRTFPPDGPDQKVMRRTFKLLPRNTAIYDRDAWGNTTAKATFWKPIESWSIELHFLVETFRKDPFEEYSKWNCLPAPEEWPREVQSYLSRPGDAWENQPDVRAWAEHSVDGILGAFNQAHAMMKRLHRECKYRVDSTTLQTSPAEFLSQKKGVCQDFTNLLICAARSIGLPARYVSGYIYTGKKSQTFTTNHAWAEIYFSQIGWAGFDAANGVLADDTHVRMAHGAWFKHAAPVSGSFSGPPTKQTLKTEVHVKKAES